MNALVGGDTGLHIDIGHGLTQITRSIDGKHYVNETVKTRIAGQFINDYAKHLVSEAHSKPALLDREIIKDNKER